MKPLPTILTGSILVITILVFYRVFRKKMGELGKMRQLHGEQMMQWVNQGLGGIKWDNKPHWKNLKTFPHHRHEKDKVYSSHRINIDDVIKTIKERVN